MPLKKTSKYSLLLCHFFLQGNFITVSGYFFPGAAAAGGDGSVGTWGVFCQGLLLLCLFLPIFRIYVSSGAHKGCLLLFAVTVQGAQVGWVGS